MCILVRVVVGCSVVVVVGFLLVIDFLIGFKVIARLGNSFSMLGFGFLEGSGIDLVFIAIEPIYVSRRTSMKEGHCLERLQGEMPTVLTTHPS